MSQLAPAATGRPRKKGDGVRPRSDLYETPPEATLALLDAWESQMAADNVARPRVVWEPACGRGAISDVLKERGYVTFASDLNRYGFGVGGVDFLLERGWPDGFVIDAIVTNPPYGRLMLPFIAHALTLAPAHVVMLLPLSAYAGVLRAHVMGPWSGLKRIFCFADRITMWADGAPRGDNSGMQTFGWFWWQRGHVGAAAIERIDSRPFKAVM